MEGISLKEQKELDELLKELDEYIAGFLKKEEIDLIHRALRVAMETKGTIRSRSGRLSILKTLHVTRIAVKEMVMGRNPLMAALLYEAVFHDQISIQEVRTTYGEKTVIIVEGLLQALDLYKRKITIESDNFKDFLLTFSKDVRVVLLIIANRLYTMRNLKCFPEEIQENISKESSFIYAPLAHKLGLYLIKTELEDLSLKYLQPDIYFDIAQKLNENKRERDRYITSFIAPIQERLENLGLKFEIKGRTKSIHSIYNKVHKQNTRFEDVYDLFAIRIVVDIPEDLEKSTCWQVYSIITDMYIPNPKRLRDWLSLPKSNGYESLHITVMGPEGKWVEVQIRSKRMNEDAETGAAAHWRYKGVRSAGAELDKWLGDIREVLEDGVSKSADMMEDLQLNLQEKEVFIFTPKGDVRKFPKGSTILDFAFDIHTNVGSRCVGAIANGKNVSFKYELRNGDQITLNTSPSQTPKSEWLNIVCTSRARTKIKQALREALNKEADFGKEILKRRFKNWKVELNEMSLSKYTKKWGRKTVTEFYAAIYQGIIDPVEVRTVLHPTTAPEDTETLRESRTIENYIPAKQENAGGDVLTIDKNLKNIMYKLSKCCNPIYGDLIFGFITTTDGIKIHKESCPNAAQMRERFPYRIVKTAWSGTSKDKYLTRLHITGNDDIGIISNISSVLSAEFKVAIHSISVDSSDGIFQGMLTIQVENTIMLDKIINRISRVKGIMTVKRVGER